MWQWQTFTLIKIGHWFRKTCRTLTLTLSLYLFGRIQCLATMSCILSWSNPFDPLTCVFYLDRWPDLRPGDGCSPDCKVEALYESKTYTAYIHILGALTLLIELYPSRSSKHSMANIFSHFFCWGVPTAVSFCVRFAKFDVEPWTQVGSFGIFGFSDRIPCIPNWKSFGCPPLPYQGWSKTSIRGLWWWQQLGSGQRKSEWKPVQQLPVLLVLRALLV